MTMQMRGTTSGEGGNEELIEDLTFLTQHAPSSVAQILQRRSLTHEHYTRIGARILVALNPYTNSFDDSMESYLQPPILQEAPPPPHIYQLSSIVYFHLKRSGIDQTVLFSGDSGSGKSHALTQFLRFMAQLRKKSQKETKLFEQITMSQVIFDAFSTASTTTHHHASRVGRYIELQFDTRGRTIGVKQLDYLLEKERVVHVPSGESNFHVFYQMLAGLTPEERSTFHLQDAAHYHYLQGTACPYSPSLLESQFHTLKHNLKSLGFNRQSQSQIFQLLASILHLGNIGFTNPGAQANTDPALVRNPDVLDLAADFLGLMPTTLEGLLTYKSILIKKEMCTIFLDANDAAVQRDDLVQTLYSLLFAWMVEHINSRLCKDTQDHFIGLLDLPGFQARPGGANSFGCFLVNYANERLFNYCCFQVFEASNAAYEEDGLSIPTMEYLGNQSVIHLLGNPSTGMVALLDKQANRAKGPATDSVLMQALGRTLSTDPKFQLDRTHSQFTIDHFARPVTYSIAGFMEANRAAIGADFIFTFRGESDIPVGNDFVSGLFTSEALAFETHPKNTATIMTAQKPQLPTRQPSMKRARVKGSNKSDKTVGAAAQFQIAMDELFDTFDNTETWFVMCLNSNTTQSPRRVDLDFVTQQVERYGMATMAQRKQVEYTVCYQHNEFVARYQDVLLASGIALTQPSDGILLDTKAMFGWEEEHMAIGHQFTYLCDGVWRDLEENLIKSHQDGLLPVMFHEDTQSYYSDDDPNLFYDNESKYSGSQDGDIFLTKAENQLGLDEEDDNDEEPVTSVRKWWIACTWFTTWWAPSCCLSWCGGMKLKEVRMAWREKVTLCFLIFILCSTVVLFIVGLNPLICPTRQIYSSFEVSGFNTPAKPLVSLNGKVFDLRGLTTHYGTNQNQLVKVYAGNDVTAMFPMQLSSLCQRYDGKAIDESLSLSNTTLGSYDKNAQYHDHRYYRGPGYYQPDWYQNTLQRMSMLMKAGDLAVDPSTLQKKAAQNYFWVMLNNRVYDLNNYVIGNLYTLTPPNVNPPTTPGYSFMDPHFIDLVRAGTGKDITLAFQKLYANDPVTKAITLQCLNNVFYSGVLDDRQSFKCIFAQYILLALSIFLFAILFVKFLASLQLGSRPDPEDHDKFVICNVPCYTEGEESLRTTIDSLAVLGYDDKRKLLFIVADGMVMGGGNDLPTPRIVLNILGTDPGLDPEPLSFYALGDGMKQHNMAKVYTGLYECKGHVVPYIVVVKVGKPSERAKPGNRGKRDSQMILMRFFNKVHYDSPMVPLELEMYHQIKNIIGVDPHLYEFILMIDADTVVMPDSLNRLISVMLHDMKIMGICGETALANEKDTWATMIQVYEYFISHHLAKAFESLFGSVTCLPGCFCLYRIRAPNMQPLLVSNVMIHDYSENKVDTLHMKNLLHLGEDRYLSTLMLKHFPFYKMTFTPDAKCLTNAPDTWDVLLSQRRRWINSTVHNLLELVFLPRLCGFCCFSMRFVVFMDLLSTIIMPATLGYLGYLTYRLVVDPSAIPVISLCFIAAPYVLQMIVFIIRRQWQHIGWMVVYLLALPVFAFFIPLYSFWHFDDFSWGNTRIVVGENGRRKKIVVANGIDDAKFDPKSIPTKKWSEYEDETWEAHTVASGESKMTYNNNEPDYYNHMYQPSPHYYPPSQVPSQVMLPTMNESQIFVSSSPYYPHQPY